MVSLEWYRSFLHIYRRGTVSSAAQSLRLTQPAISQHLSALENVLGESLFVRTARRMVPTEAGKALYTRIAQSIEQLEAVTAENPAEERSEIVRLGTPVEFFTERVLESLPRLDRLHYAVSFGLSQFLLEELFAGNLDVVLSTVKVARSEVSYEQAFEEKFWLVGPANIKPPRGARLEPWLRQQSWVAYGPELPIIRRFWRQVFAKRLDIQPRLIVPDLRAICRAVEKGWGVSVLPDYLCRDAVQRGTMKAILTPKVAVTNDLWLVYRKEQQNTYRVKVLRDFLAQLSN